MDKSEVFNEKSLAQEKKDIHDVEPQIELDEEDDSPIEEVRVTVTSKLVPYTPYTHHVLVGSLLHNKPSPICGFLFSLTFSSIKLHNL